jgi:hypothetical protein
VHLLLTLQLPLLQILLLLPLNIPHIVSTTFISIYIYLICIYDILAHKPTKLRRKSELVKLKLVAKVNSLGVVLTEHGKKLAQFAIVGTQADLTMKDNSMLVAVHEAFLFCFKENALF